MRRTVTAFLGDSDRTFALTNAGVIELELVLGVGIGAIASRLFDGGFRLVEVVETIRLGLIGGGETPKRARELVDFYVVERPLSESYGLAVSIVEALMIGAPATTEGEGA